MFKIFQASEDDVPAIIAMAEGTWWPTYLKILSREQIRYMLDTIYSPDLLRSQINSGTQTFLILSADGKPQAFASFEVHPYDEKVYKINRLYVLPNNQRKGYGAALVNEIKQRVSERNICTLDLNVNRFNPARHFYERIGFKVIREEDVPVGPYWMNDYVMRLEF
ncbi:MAG: GNAT family N-acetyltransferase [Bacteroidota bacterium]|nr:GNAT family N-acetyltransferase [Bacteroidota bacterium]